MNLRTTALIAIIGQLGHIAYLLWDFTFSIRMGWGLKVNVIQGLEDMGATGLDIALLELREILEIILHSCLAIFLIAFFKHLKRSETTQQLPAVINNEEKKMNSNITEKKILPAFLLCIFLGWTGAHRFYAGKVGAGLLQIVLFATAIVTYGFGAYNMDVKLMGMMPVIMIVIGIWLLVDFIRIVIGAYTDSQGNKITQWT